jgi:hypothetical protein
VVASGVDTWATVAVAIGTVGTVVYALFRDVFVMPRRRPSLELRFEPAGNDQVVVRTAEGTEIASARLRVVNGKGKDTADDVVVMVTELRRLADSDNAVSESRPIGVPLTWSGTNPPLTVASVHPGSQRHIDLLHVTPSTAQLGVSPKPAGGQDVLEPGAYEISAEIRARNADAKAYVIPVALDGSSPDIAGVWQHLRIEPPRRDR